MIVTGRLRQRSFETQDGDKPTAIEMDVEGGPSLAYAMVKPDVVAIEQRPGHLYADDGRHSRIIGSQARMVSATIVRVSVPGTPYTIAVMR